MAYDFYMGDMLLPVSPSKLQIKIKNKNSTIVMINEGEINLLKTAGLTEISFTTLLPQQKYPFATYKSGFQKADVFLQQIEKLKTDNKAFQFIVSRTSPSGKLLFDTNIKVSLEDYEITEDTKNGLDLEVKFSLKQYREYSTKTVKVTIEQAKPKATVQETRSGTASNNGNYTVVKGDCLWNIAKKYYGNGASWPTIYNANIDTIENAARSRGKASSSNGHWIYPGTVLVIP